MTLFGFFDRSSRAIVKLTVRGSDEEAVLFCEIDTGAEPALSISHAWADRLGMSGADGHTATLADGSLVEVLLSNCYIEWLSGERRIDAIIWPADHIALPDPSGPRRYRERPDALIGRKLFTDALLKLNYVDRTIEIKAVTPKGA